MVVVRLGWDGMGMNRGHLRKLENAPNLISISLFEFLSQFLGHFSGNFTLKSSNTKIPIEVYLKD